MFRSSLSFYALIFKSQVFLDVVARRLMGCRRLLSKFQENGVPGDSFPRGFETDGDR